MSATGSGDLFWQAVMAKKTVNRRRSVFIKGLRFVIIGVMKAFIFGLLKLGVLGALRVGDWEMIGRIFVFVADISSLI